VWTFLPSEAGQLRSAAGDALREATAELSDDDTTGDGAAAGLDDELGNGMTTDEELDKGEVVDDALGVIVITITEGNELEAGTAADNELGEGATTDDELDLEGGKEDEVAEGASVTTDELGVGATKEDELGLGPAAEEELGAGAAIDDELAVGAATAAEELGVIVTTITDGEEMGGGTTADELGLGAATDDKLGAPTDNELGAGTTTIEEELGVRTAADDDVRVGTGAAAELGVIVTTITDGKEMGGGTTADGLDGGQKVTKRVLVEVIVGTVVKTVLIDVIGIPLLMFVTVAAGRGVANEVERTLVVESTV
jgi:hypothetical protein